MNKNEKKLGAGIGLGVAALAAATAGAMFLYGKEGAKHRKQIKGWAIKMKGDVIEKLEQLKDLNEDTYKKVIDQVADKYRKVKNMDLAQLEGEVKGLKSHWRNISDQIYGKKKAKAVKKRRPQVTQPRRGAGRRNGR